jgi:ATP-binding cassette subfamily F protein 3
MISLNNIGLHFGSRKLFDNINFSIIGKERISLIGVNGSGKTTLLKIICGIQETDEGNINVSKYSSIGYLPQEDVVFSGKTIYQEVLDSIEDINLIESKISSLEYEISLVENKSGDNYFDLITELAEQQEKFLLNDGYKLKSKTEKILTGLGFSIDDFNRPTDEFSGGWQMRIAIAKLLIKNPSVLLLDEPTNHLDLDSLLWFENYLREYQGAILVVSHDRSFLDRISEKTAELSYGKLTIYKGNYSKYIELKNIQNEFLMNQIKNQEKYIKQQERFIERFRYKATKARAVQSRIKQLDKLDKIETEEKEEFINFDFLPAVHSGKVTIEINGLTKSYDGKNNVLQNIDLIMKRGDKFAFVGVNGAGKTTLAKIIAGIEEYNDGIVNYGHNILIKYFAQDQSEELNGEYTVLETMERIAGEITPLYLRNILGCFLFRGDDVFKKVKVLSGGEKSRLALAKILIEPSNFLVLDEPTNHLDISSKNILMNALKNYQGSIIVVSHDREFLDGFVNHIVEFKNKSIKNYIGTCSEFIEKREKLSVEEKSADKITDLDIEIIEDKSEYYSQKEKKKNFRKKLNYHKKLVAEIENNLHFLEKRKNELENVLIKEDFYKDVQKSVSVKKEYENILKEIEDYQIKWEIESKKLIELENIINY